MSSAVASEPARPRAGDPLVWASTLVERRLVLATALAHCRNAQERLGWLIEQARTRPPLPADLRTAPHRVPGCLSQLWLVAEFRDGRCWFRCDSDSQVVRAVAILVAEVYSGCGPSEIIGDHSDWLASLGLDRLLTPNRRTAQARVGEQIRAFAAGHLTTAPATAKGATH